MEQALPPQPHNTQWYMYKNLVIAWLVFFWPIGLYGLWKTSVFTKPVKWQIAGLVVCITLVFGGTQQFNLLLVFFLYPVGLYLVWKDTEILP